MNEQKEEKPARQLFRHDLFVNGEFVGIANDWDELDKVLNSLRPDRRSGNWREVYSCSGGGYGYEVHIDASRQKSKIIHHKMNSLLTDCEGNQIYMGDRVVDDNGYEGKIDTTYKDEEHLYFIHNRNYMMIDDDETGSSYRVIRRLEDDW